MSEISKLDQNLIIRKIDSETINIQITNNTILMSIVGQFDQNLKDFSEAIKFLISKYLLTNFIEKGDIMLSVKKDMKTEESNIKSFKQLIKTPRKSVIARSEKQSDYIKALKENNIVMSLGPAGTGKSFLAVSVAVALLMEKKIERVILSRPAVEAGEKLGFLPGDITISFSLSAFI